MKQKIIDFLIANGFILDSTENKYTKKIHKQVGETIINGQHHIEYKDVKITIEYIGDGWEGISETINRPLTQWKVFINGNDQGDFLVHDLEEFKNTI